MFYLLTGEAPAGACDRDHTSRLVERYQGFGIDVVARAFSQSSTRRYADAKALLAAAREELRFIENPPAASARRHVPVEHLTTLVAPPVPSTRESESRPAHPAEAEGGPAPKSASVQQLRAQPAAQGKTPEPLRPVTPPPKAAPPPKASSTTPRAAVIGAGRPTTTGAQPRLGDQAIRLRGELTRRLAVLSSQTHYEILEVSNDVSTDEIKAAFRSLAKRFHPDRVGAVLEDRERVQAETLFETMSFAYSVLSNTSLRHGYNLELRQRELAARTEAVEGRPRDRVSVAEEYKSDARALASRGDFYGAAQALRQALYIEPESVEVQLELGRMLVRLPQRRREAEKALQRVLDLDPRQAEAHFLLGGVYRDEGMDLRAREHFKKARSLEPANARYRAGDPA